MRIGFVYDVVYPASKGGVEKRIYELARRLSERGNEVHVFCVKPRGLKRETFTTAGVAYHFVPCFFSHKSADGSRSSLQAIEFAIKVFFELAKTRLDAVDCQNFPFFPAFSSMASSFLNGSRVVVTWHEYWGGYWAEYKGPWYGRMGQFVEKALARISRFNAAVSEPVATQVGLAAKTRVAVVPNGVDLEAARSAKPLRKKRDFIYAGRLERHKRLDLLLDAMLLVARRRPKASLLIVGGGHLSGWLELYARKIGLSGNVTFLPPATEKMLLSLLKSSRVFVLPSSREGFGMAALEANACGLPVVTVDLPLNATVELVTEKNGLVCAPDPGSLAGAMLSMLEKPPSKAGITNSTKKFGWSGIVDAELSLLSPV